MVAFLLSEAFRDLRRAGRVAVSAIVLIMLSLGSVGAFLLLADNLGSAVTTWRDRLRIIVYLKQEPSPAAASALVQRVRGFEGVGAARFVSRAEALASLKRVLGKDAGAADHAAVALPASIEIAPSPIGGTPDGARALIRQLSLMPEAEEVAGGVEWVDRLARLQRLATLVGLGFGAVLAVAAILTITTATTLVLHARRYETEVMRLVGAPEFTIRLPLLLQGMFQGLLGALLALGALAVAYHFAAPQVAPLLTLALGVEGIAFLPPAYMIAIVAIGTALGALGGFLARGRRHA
jgi:cell division transport system permease protein